MDLKKMALVLIYHDGEVEEIPITDTVWHTDYMKRQVVKSPRFANICKGLEIEDGPHYDVDIALAKHNVISLFNGNIYEILNDPEWAANNYAWFIVYLPEDISVEQAKKFNDIIKDYPEEYLIVGKFSKEMNDYQEIETAEMKRILSDIQGSIHRT